MPNVTFDFTGKSVLITGAARGIGYEVARAFQEWGANTYIVDFDEEALAVASLESGISTIQADVTDSLQVNRAVDQVIRETGRIDVLINNAGILRDRMLWKLEDNDWDAVLATHVGGTFKFSRAVVPHMRNQGSGRIINVTSYTGIHGNPGQANYAAAKAGILGFTYTAAKELAGFGITVNAISPNASTRMVASIPEDRLRELEAGIPMGRFADPREVAPAMGFLSSEEAAYITGVVLPVDGGISI